jgi:tetratricopeptide (TPR) repeat protein
MEKKNLSESDLINLSFALGKAHDKLNNFDKAFTYFNKANKMQKTRVNFNLEDLLKLTNSIKSFFSNLNYDQIRKLGNQKKIIFICGMPRSGTTLIEQIISAHNEVFPTGENNFLSAFIKKNYLKGFTLDQRKITKDIYSKNNLFDEYIFNLFNELGYTSNVFTDKSVQNFLWIGFIKTFFPKF